MSLSVNKTRLATITKELLLRWEETRHYWKDAKAEEFERKYIDELIASADSAIGVVDKLDKVIAKIRSDCE